VISPIVILITSLNRTNTLQYFFNSLLHAIRIPEAHVPVHNDLKLSQVLGVTSENNSNVTLPTVKKLS